MARPVCSSCGKTLTRMDLVRRKAHRTDQGYYCDDCFSGMLSDATVNAAAPSKELEDDVDLLEALEESLPDDGMPEVDEGPIDPGAATVTAPAPEQLVQASESTVRDVRREFLGEEGPATSPPQPGPVAKKEPRPPPSSARIASAGTPPSRAAAAAALCMSSPPC